MNISDILGDSLKKQLKDSLSTNAETPTEIDPLEKQTKKSRQRVSAAIFAYEL